MTKLEKAIAKTTNILKENKNKSFYEIIRILCVDDDIYKYYDLISELILEVRSQQRNEELIEEEKNKNEVKGLYKCEIL